MSFLIEKISNIIIKNNNIINENIVGINYFEKLKYLIINSLKDIQDKFEIDNLIADLKNENNQSTKFEFKNNPLILSINLYKDSLSKIKSSYKNDTLSVVVKGIKVISLFDLHDRKKKETLSISKNMGLVLSENISADSIIMDIVSEKKAMIVEK